MSDPFGFIKYKRVENTNREVTDRILDFEELQTPLDESQRRTQASRCMNCGIPFCHSGYFYGTQNVVSGCPNDNLIPEWNDLLSRGEYRKAFDRLSKTNPLPEMTGRVCPAPCEKSCTENLNGSGVTIHDNERFIIDHAFTQDWVEESGLPVKRLNTKIAIIGSGPAGLSCAWRLNQLGHDVTVFEKKDEFGGLLMYGIPNMKLDKKVVQRRISVMKKVGIHFAKNTTVGVDITKEELFQTFDKVVLAIGAEVPRDLDIPNRNAHGIEFAVDFISKYTKYIMENGTKDVPKFLEGKNVVVIGGGDTGNDCLATSVRLGAKSVKQFEITSQKSETRKPENPWPEYPIVDSKGYGQIEAETVYHKDITLYNTSATSFITNAENGVVGIETTEVDAQFTPVEGTQKIENADLVLLALGFLGAEQKIFEHFNVQEIYDDFSTNEENVFVAGDAKRGPSLVIWAICEGRKLAEKIDEVLVAQKEQ